MSNGPDILEQLRRRGVVRAALLYAAAAFALLEFADIAFPRLGLPDGAVNAVLWIGIAGFPVALIAAWWIDLRASAERNQRTRWLAPRTIIAAATLAAAGIGMSVWWGVDDGSPMPSRSSAAEVRGPAVAVLPFADPAQTDDLFAVGLSEQIATVLARFSDIRVIAPGATSYFDEADRDIRTLDDELGVQYLLRGTVQRSPSEVRVTTQLLDASTGKQVWGDRYDAELTPAQLFATQDEIALRVASTIGDSAGVLTQLEGRQARARVPEDLRAYDCVLLGMAYFSVHTQEVHHKARACLERSVEIDPGYAEAWGHLAYMYREEHMHGYPGEPAPLERAADAAQRGIELDPSSPMPHFSMAFTRASQLDLDGAVAEIEKLIALAPHDTSLLGGVSIYLAHSGRWERAMEIAHRVEALNPLHNPWIDYTRAMVHYRRGDLGASLAAANKLDRADGQTHIHLAVAYAGLGRDAEARASAREFMRLAPDFVETPDDYLRRVFLRDEAIARYVEGLSEAGLEIEPGRPARLATSQDDQDASATGTEAR